MALNKEDLKINIIEAFQAVQKDTENPDESLRKVADKLATAIDDYVRSAQIVYNTGLTAPNGPVTGTFNGQLR